MNAHIHAQSSVKRYGGTIEDYLAIHVLMDSSKGSIPHNGHRLMYHNAEFITHILPKIFGDYIVNGDDKKVYVRQIGEDHILEDFGGKFVPTVADYLQGWTPPLWTNNGIGDPPPSAQVLPGLKASITEKNKNPDLCHAD